MQTLNSGPEIIDLSSGSDYSDFSTGDFLPPDDVETTFKADDHSPASSRHESILNPPNLLVVSKDGRTEYERCLSEVLEVFPDISHDYVHQTIESWTRSKELNGEDHEQNLATGLISQILDAGKYPKERDRINELKRKRSQEPNSEEEETAQWKNAKRELETCVYHGEARIILQEDFPKVPSRFIDATLKDNGSLFASYLALELAESTYSESKNPPYTRLKVPRKFKSTSVARLQDMEAEGYGMQELKKEILAARNRRKKIETKRQIKKDAAVAEAEIEQEYRKNGDVLECLCCFESYPINKLTHCNGEELHFFCLECAETYAKNEIGSLRYELTCMAGGGCTASFSREQKQRFMTASSFEAIERIQQQAELRLAELTNLSTCPFCDYAAICPPVDIDKEFRCRNPECEKISCRLCKLNSHLPLTCLESKKENGISERHVLEEARTEALLRTCPKCKVKILKSDGCNKVTCPCGGMLCDYCGSDISSTGYKHFDNGVSSLGKKCPTYDNAQARHTNEVEKAEAAAIKKVRAENPNITAEDLKINFKDGAEIADQSGAPAPPYGYPGYHAQVNPQRIPGVGAMNHHHHGVIQPHNMVPPPMPVRNELRQGMGIMADAGYVTGNIDRVEYLRGMPHVGYVRGTIHPAQPLRNVPRAGFVRGTIGREQQLRNEPIDLGYQANAVQGESTGTALAPFGTFNNAHLQRQDIGKQVAPRGLERAHHGNQFHPNERNFAGSDWDRQDLVKSEEQNQGRKGYEDVGEPKRSHRGWRGDGL